MNCSLGSFEKPLILRKRTEMIFSGRRNVILSTGQTGSLANIMGTQNNQNNTVITDLCGSTFLAEKAAIALVMIVDTSC